MSRDINGNYTLPAGNPVAPGTLIEATWANSTLTDVAAALTDSLSRSGSGGMLAPFYNASGSIGAPGIAWKDEPTSGWYRKGLNEFWYVVGGAEVFGITATGIALTAGKTFSGLTLLTSPLQINSTLGVTGLITATGGIHAVATSQFDGNVAILGTLSAAGVALSGAFSGTFNGTVGGVTPADGKFTTMSASGLITATGGVAGPVTGALNGTLGATTPSTALVTTLGASGLITATGGVAGAVTGALNGTLGATTPSTALVTTLGASGLITATGGVAGALNGTVGATTPAAGAFTTLSASQMLTAGAGMREHYLAIAALDIDLALGSFFSKTIAGATAFTVSNVGASPAVSSYILELTNGGSAAVTWPTGTKWAGGTAPTLTAAGVDLLGFYSHDNVTWRGMVLALDNK